MKTLSFHILSLIIALSAATTVVIHVLQRWWSRSWTLGLLFVALTLLFTWAIHQRAMPFVQTRLQSAPKSTRWKWILISIFAGAFLSVAFPLRPPSRHHLQVIPLSQRNSQAKGNQVIVIGVYHTGGTQVPVTDLHLGPGWEVRGGFPIWIGPSQGSLDWNGVFDGNITVHLVSHAWSGVVRVSLDAQREEVRDLYAPPERGEVIALSLASAVRSGPGSVLLALISYLCGSLTLAAVVLATAVAFTAAVWHSSQASPLAWFGFSLPCVAAWTLYLLAFWPGLMSYDSILQWEQMLHLNLDNSHPVFHTLTIWLLTHIWRSPATVALVQLLMLASIFGWLMVELGHWGVPQAVRVALTVAFSVSPVNGILSVTLWKDVPYTIALLAVFGFLLKVVRTRGHWLKSSHRWPLAFSLLLAALYRHNGIPVVALILGSLFILAGRDNWTRMAALAAVLLGLFVFLTGPVQSALRVKPLDSFYPSLVQIHQIQSIFQRHPDLPPQTEQILSKIQPLEQWRKNYVCCSYEQSARNPLDRELLRQHSKELTEIWSSLIWKYPRALVERQLCVTSMIWQILQPPDGYLFCFYPDIYPNSLGLAPASLFPAAKPLLRSVLDWTSQPNERWWSWRPALYLYLCIFCGVVASIRRLDAKTILVFTPALANAAVMMVINVAQDFRYQYPVYVIGLISPALLFCKRASD